MKHSIDEIRDELREDQKKLSSQDFVKKYGKTPDQLEALSDAELEKVAGGRGYEIGNKWVTGW